MQHIRARRSVITSVMGAAILLFCGIAAQRASAIPQAAAAQAGNAEEGRKLFQQVCSKCHAPDGSGNTPIGKAIRTKDLRAPEAQKLSDAEIFNQIAMGSGNMPALADAIRQAQADDLRAKVNDLTAYIREMGKKQTGAKKP